MINTVIVGVGNAFRGDDGVGRYVVQQLAGQLPSGARTGESSGEALSLMEQWGDARVAIIVDAIDAGKDPGSVVRMDASEKALPTAAFHSSTHAFSVSEAIELARSLGQLPEVVIVFGIQGAMFDHGEGLSEEAKRGAAEAIDRILAEIVDSNAEART